MWAAQLSLAVVAVVPFIATAVNSHGALLRRDVDSEAHPTALKGQHRHGGSDEEWRAWWRLGGTGAAVPAGAASGLQIEDVTDNEGEKNKHRMSTPTGLPFSNGTAPPWLVRQDGLVIDARKRSEIANGGGMLLVHVVSQDASYQWETKNPQRPNWLRAILAANRHHVQEYGHAMVLRWAPTQPILTDWQKEKCKKNNLPDVRCHNDNERENINWEKHLMLLDYLKSPQNFSHVLMLDADAMFVRPDLDTMRRLSVLLEEKGNDLFLSDEDWLKHGEGRINGGVLFAKNTNFTRALFQDLWECHRNLRIEHPRTLDDGGMGCGGNEMDALNEWHGRRGMKAKMHVASGKRWNRGGEVLFRKSETDANEEMYYKGMKDPNLEIMHFMGGAKPGAVDVVCNKKYGMVWNLTGEGPHDYGCAPVVPI